MPAPPGRIRGSYRRTWPAQRGFPDCPGTEFVISPSSLFYLPCLQFLFVQLIVHVSYVRVKGDFMANLGERLKLLRKEKGLTQVDMAEQFHQSPRAYQYYEANTRRPEYDHLIALADFFDVSLDYLIGRSETRERQP